MPRSLLPLVAFFFSCGLSEQQLSEDVPAQPEAAEQPVSAVILEDGFESSLSGWTVSASGQNRAVVKSDAWSDGFEAGLGNWTLTGGATQATSPVFEGSKALLLDYQGSYTSATRALGPTTDVRLRIYFYDDLDATLGTLFQAAGSGAQVNCGTASAPSWVNPHTGLGVKTDLAGSSYVVRLNCLGVTGSHGMFTAEERVGTALVPVARRKGWHLFELNVTPQGTFARIDDRLVSRSNAQQTNVTQVSLGSTWNLTGRSVYDAFSMESGYQSRGSLFLDYVDGTNSQAVVVSRAVTGRSNFVARTFFFDTMDPSLGTMFLVKDSTDAWQTGLGVSADVAAANYVVRFNKRSTPSPCTTNCYEGTFDTGLPRSAGWHMFEVVVTDRGTYAKVDNALVRSSAGTIRKNTGQTVGSVLAYVSTWSLTGMALYDGLKVVAADTAPWQDQLYGVLASHYRTYGAQVPPGNALVFEGLYPQLGYCPSYDRACGLHSNDFRSLMFTALVFYRHGVKAQDANARALGKRAFLEAYANAPWKRGQPVDNWARGAALRGITHAARELWAELDGSTRAAVVADLYAQAATYLNRLPESGYVSDTKSEENAWHAAFLASLVNFFPNAPNQDKEWLEAKARCFAFHSITRSADGVYCGLDTQTVHDTWVLENHGQVNPAYSSGTLALLAEGAFTYRMVGRPVPWEFTHNVQPLFEKYLTYVDRDTYHFVNSPPDWDGAHNSAFISPLVFRYMDVLGVPTGVPWADYLGRRSMFFHDMVSSWVKKTPSYVRLREWNQSDKNEDSYRFFLDAVDAGEFYATATYELPSVCEVAPDRLLHKQKIWAGQLTFACDRTNFYSGGAAVRLSATTPSNVEAYSDLIAVSGNRPYKVSYVAKTSALVASAAEPAGMLGRVVPAQYGPSASELDPVSSPSRLDAGLSLGQNLSGTTGWTARSYDFSTSSGAAYVRLRGILAGMGRGTGEAWFDGVQLTALTKRTGTCLASTSDPTTPCAGAFDGSLGTRWSGNGDGAWLRLDLGAARDVSVVRVAFYLGDQRTARFDLQVSADGASWVTVFSGQSAGNTTGLQTIDVADRAARYVRLVGHGNSQNTWNSVTELEVWGR